MLHNACNRTIGAMGDTREGVAEFAVLADAYLAEGGETATTALAAGPAYQHRPIRSAEPLALPI